MMFLLVVFWMVFAGMLYVSERASESTEITSYGDALYWGVAAFSTAGIADTPSSGISKIIGGVWIIIGSVLFFGAIVASVTAYFMRPLHRPVHQIVDAIEYNLEQLEDLTVDELDLLRKQLNLIVRLQNADIGCVSSNPFGQIVV